ncbi:MAG: hypothetical protein PHP17_06665, partial [Candidatus Omnitrophica bacterium]|nr:hypothetical protein [Candidatus Omnitrophota bacterium]
LQNCNQRVLRSAYLPSLLMASIIYVIFLLGFISGFLIGLFLAVKPFKAIELQKKFYAKINWNIEPISMEKEIRNTRIMGLFLAVTGAMAAVFLLNKIY